MRGTALAVLPLIFLWFTQNPVSAQQRGMMPHLQLHAVNPSLSLSAPAANPLQQQNPSGLGRQGLAIGRKLNSYTGPH
jgi:hypothetical protein